MNDFIKFFPTNWFRLRGGREGTCGTWSSRKRSSKAVSGQKGPKLPYDSEAPTYSPVF